MRRAGNLIVAVALAATCAGCAPAGGEPGSVVTRAEDEESLTIGIRFDQPGLSERTVDGRFVGFDVDVATHVAGELGVPPENITWRETVPAQRESDITSGAVDLVVAAYSITDERKRQVGFAGPYFETGQDLLVRRSAADITGPASLAGRRLCSVTGSTSAEQVKQRFARSVHLREYPRNSDCVTALLAGQVDAVTTDAAILAGFVAQNPELLRLVGTPLSTERYGVGLRKDDAEGRAAVAAAIEHMIDTGAWRESLRRHLGRAGLPLPDPPEVTER